MKLRLLVQDDPVERLTVGLHNSVVTKLREYKAFYETALNGSVQQNYLIEEMLKSCMADDKDFQKYLKSTPRAKDEGKPAAPLEVAASSDNTSETSLD